MGRRVNCAMVRGVGEGGEEVDGLEGGVERCAGRVAIVMS